MADKISDTAAQVSILKEVFTSRPNVWATRPVEDEPEITLVRWRVIETEKGERHFVGWSIEGREGRVSTAIQSFDQESFCGVTRSGRVYRLAGEPGFDNDGMYVWGVWSRMNQVVSQQDVTEEVYACKR